MYLMLYYLDKLTIVFIKDDFIFLMFYVQKNRFNKFIKVIPISLLPVERNEKCLRTLCYELQTTATKNEVLVTTEGKKVLWKNQHSSLLSNYEQ